MAEVSAGGGTSQSLGATLAVKFGITVALATAFGLAINAGPALAGSQCFKNLDKRLLYITLQYANGDKVVMRLRPGEKRRFNNVGAGDSYCYSFNVIEGDDCPNRNDVHLTSCQNPNLM
jgi:hypothetical protein